jgi:hypothetical protein
MSIKTIGSNVQSNTKGLEKEINVGAKRLIFDVLQSTQYSTPIPSTIRELVTNACDSQREKEIAINILTGVNKVEDYYISRDGEEYNDSNFDPSYYDLNCLNRYKNNIRINYFEDDNGVGFCDTVEIIDYGVGIGGKRLEGISQLGFSTKRNTSENFGAFGLGSKVALSTGVPYYTIETVHNYKKVIMNCYPYKTDFVVSKFTADGEIELSNGDVVYYNDVSTSDDNYNYTKITFKVKKHNRNAFKEAVQSQLTYFDNVEFYYNNGWYPCSSPSLYNTDNIIVGVGSYFARPHIVIVKHPGDTTGINYGAIDFKELELEELRGNVGIKCPIRQSYLEDGVEVLIQDGVDVTPSREKVIWNENTKKYLLNMIEKASQDCSDIVEEALSEEDFSKWLRLCTAVLFKPKNNSTEIKNKDAIYEIAKMVNPSKIKPKFNGRKFESPQLMFPYLTLRKITRKPGKSKKAEFDRIEVSSWADVDFDKLYVGEGTANYYIDRFLTDTHTSFYLITPSQLIESTDIDMFLNTELQKYSEVNLPATYKTVVDTADNTEVEDNDLAALRKANGEVVGHTIRYSRLRSQVIWDKIIIKISKILDSKVTTYYGNLDEDGYKLKVAANICYKQAMYIGEFTSTMIPHYDDYNGKRVLFHEEPSEYLKNNSRVGHTNSGDKIQIIGFSKANMKYAESNPNWKHVDEFFFELKDNSQLVPTEIIKDWLTAEKIQREVNLTGGDYNWMHSFKNYFPEAHNLYEKLLRYTQTNGSFYYTSTWLGDIADEERENAKALVSYLKNLERYHEILKTNDNELIAQTSYELFVVSLGNIEIIRDDLFDVIDHFKELGEGVTKYFVEAHKNLGSDTIQQWDPIWNHIIATHGKHLIEVPKSETLSKF